MDENGHIYLADNGMARYSTFNGEIYHGSHSYIAPEILENGNLTKDADFWSLGILIYELLFGIFD